MPTDKEPKLMQIPVKGIDLGNGSIQTEEGIVRIPLSKLRKNKKEQKEELKHDMSNSSRGVDILSTLPRRVNPEERSLSFESPMGIVTGKYFPVIDTGDFIVLGLTEQSFVPLSYKQNKDLKLTLQNGDNRDQVVYSGCRFRDPDTEREYIVLIKIGDQK
jgi:hypothetical protein